MVCVAQNDLAVDVLQLIGQNALQRALRADRHKDGRRDIAVAQPHQADTRLGRRALC